MEKENSNPWMVGLRAAENASRHALPTTQTAPALAVFVSHSSEDEDLAKAIITVLRDGIRLTDTDIRCTSVPGYGFEAGSEIDARLKEEVKSSTTFIGLITPSSIQSAYVLFELGARWGAGLHLAPILARGTRERLLRGPLRGLVATDGASESQMHLLVADLAKQLKRTPANPAVYASALRNWIAACGATPTEEEALAIPVRSGETRQSMLIRRVDATVGTIERRVNELADAATENRQTLLLMERLSIPKEAYDAIDSNLKHIEQVEHEIIEEAYSIERDAEWPTFRRLGITLAKLNKLAKRFDESPSRHLCELILSMVEEARKLVVDFDREHVTKFSSARQVP